MPNVLSLSLTYDISVWICHWFEVRMAQLKIELVSPSNNFATFHQNVMTVGGLFANFPPHFLSNQNKAHLHSADKEDKMSLRGLHKFLIIHDWGCFSSQKSLLISVTSNSFRPTNWPSFTNKAKTQLTRETIVTSFRVQVRHARNWLG